MRELVRFIGLVAMLALTWAFTLLHRDVCPPPDPSVLEATSPIDQTPGKWFPREQYGLNQLFVWGSPFHRGLEEGALTRELMYREEKSLIDKFEGFFPNPLIRYGFVLAAMRWFWGIDRYFEPWMLSEMYGVSRSASHQFSYLLDGYSRQLAYHGLHEVGQWFVDHGQMDMGCTVFAVPSGNSWVIGRNFDFEGGRIFDEDKIVKWVFPSKGHRFVSIIWAGMVGVVTGVNDQGVYISINAAGSADFRRYGMPTTLAVLKALQFASSAREAADILSWETTFITDIFVIADKHQVLRMEKSPRHWRIQELKGPSVVTNHLQDPLWDHDKVNAYRRAELTTEARETRGQVLLSSLASGTQPGADGLARRVLSFLRDKKSVDGKPLHLGNRAAIDALIASHSVIYDAARGVLYVSEGPSLAGKFVGFDLAATFASQGPARQVESLPADPEVTPELYRRVKESLSMVSEAEKLIAHHHCDQGKRLLDQAAQLFEGTSNFYSVKGNYEQCLGQRSAALESWKKALALEPAYPMERRALEKKVHGDK